MPKNDREVWDYLTDAPNSSIEIDLICYAIYTAEKYEWVEQYEQDHQRTPAPDLIEQWISDITPNRYLAMRETAANTFDIAARRLLADEIVRQRQQAVDASILAEVRAASSVWKQFLIGLITAIVSPLIIGGMIIASRAYDQHFPTATQVAKEQQSSATPSSGAAPTAKRQD
jgi:hypothetical protein